MRDMHQNPIDFSGPYMREKLLKPARDIRSLLRWGYPKFATISFVATHSRLRSRHRTTYSHVSNQCLDFQGHYQQLKINFYKNASKLFYYKS